MEEAGWEESIKVGRNAEGEAGRHAGVKGSRKEKKGKLVVSEQEKDKEAKRETGKRVSDKQTGSKPNR